ncbi:MAG: helix-turn-helix transcriptional regulator [Clostridia bacterium]|nr:helix-turn-helix transcriptional regulator [Clostridia bacterium]
MIFHLCREAISHKTEQFPMAFYSVDHTHPRYQMIHHWHPETELVAVRRGTLRLTLDGSVVTLKEGQFILIPSGTVHSGIPSDCRYECAVFDRRAVLNIFKGSCYLQVKQFFLTPAILPPSPALERWMNALEKQETGFEAEVLSAFYALISQWMKNPPNKLPALPCRKSRLVPFEQAVLYLQEHYKEQITLKDIAKASELSEKYFGEYFKNLTGETPVQYLNKYRIEQSAEALKEDEKSVTEIALECGFNDLSYFIKTFRRHYGISPGAYRKQQKRA